VCYLIYLDIWRVFLSFSFFFFGVGGVYPTVGDVIGWFMHSFHSCVFSCLVDTRSWRTYDVERPSSSLALHIALDIYSINITYRYRVRDGVADMLKVDAA